MGINYAKENGEIGARKTKAATIVFTAKLRDGANIPYIPTEKPQIEAKKEDEGIHWSLIS